MSCVVYNFKGEVSFYLFCSIFVFIFLFFLFFILFFSLEKIVERVLKLYGTVISCDIAVKIGLI